MDSNRAHSPGPPQVFFAYLEYNLLFWWLLFLRRQRNQPELSIDWGRTCRIINIIDAPLSACLVKELLTGELLTPRPQRTENGSDPQKSYNALGFLLLSLPGLREKQWPVVPHAIYSSTRNIKDQGRPMKLRGDCENKVSEQRQGKTITTSESEWSSKMHMVRQHVIWMSALSLS